MLKMKKDIAQKTNYRLPLVCGIWTLFYCLLSFSVLAQSLPANNPTTSSSTTINTSTTNTTNPPAETTTTTTDTAEKSSSVSGSLASRCTTSGCAKMYPEDNISQLHHKYESAGNPCAFNKCAGGDIGGCSYGSSQLECTYGSLKTFLTDLQKTNPSIWQQLGGGSVEAMNARACTKPATEFSTAWKSICSNSQAAAEFEAAQEKYMQKTYYDTAVNAIKKDFGIDFNSLSPELQMSLFSVAVAMGSPGGARKLMNSIKNNIGDPAQMTEEELLEAMYVRRDYFYGSSSEAIRNSVQKRNAREGSEALESLKIRKAWEAEQQKPANERRSYEEVVKEVTGRDACTGNKSASFNCDASGASGGSGSGSSGSSSSGSASGGSSDADVYNQKDCSPSQYKVSYGSCMMCPLFAVIFNTASTIAKLSFDKLAMPVMSVVLVAWAIWMATQILMFVSSFKTKDAPTLIKTLLNKSFVVLIVVLFLQADSGTFFAMLMEPIFNTGFKLAQMASTDSACSISQYFLKQDGGLPVSMGESILCALQAIQGRLLDTLSLGAASICIGFYVKGKLFIFPSLGYVFSGLLIFCGAAIVIVIFPFLLIDSIFQLTVACALLPAAIGAYPFKTTNKYVKNVWNIFMNAIFNFVFMSLVIYILTGAIENTITEGGIKKLNDSNFQESIITTLAWGGVTLLKIVFILLLTWTILEEVNTYASQFAPSMVPGGSGRAIGGMAAKGVKDMGKKAYGGAKKVGGVLAENAKERFGDMRRNAQMRNVQKHGTEQLITDKDGNVIGKSYTTQNKSWLRGRNKTQTVTIMNNGTKMLEKSKDYGNGKIVTTRSDGYLKQVQTLQKDENTGQMSIVSSNVEIQSAGLKAARNKDGSLNTVSMELALKNSAFSEKMIKAAVMQQYARQSLTMNSDIPIPQNITDENITISTDKDGREVIEVVNPLGGNANNILRMHMPDQQKENGNRVLLEAVRQDDRGNEVSFATDGMINRQKSKRLNEETGKFEERENYAMSHYYAERSKYGVDAYGNLSNIFEEHGGFAYSADEHAKIVRSLQRNRQRSKTASISGLL